MQDLWRRTVQQGMSESEANLLRAYSRLLAFLESMVEPLAFCAERCDHNHSEPQKIKETGRELTLLLTRLNSTIEMHETGKGQEE